MVLCGVDLWDDGNLRRFETIQRSFLEALECHYSNGISTPSSWASLILCPIEHGLAYAWDFCSYMNYKKHNAYGAKPHIIHASLKEEVGHEHLFLA